MKAETDLYCPTCRDKIYEKGDELMSLFFTRSEEKCSNCDAVLKRRSPGGQSDTWNFTVKPRVRGGEYALYKDEEVWVANARPSEDRALIVHDADLDNPNAKPDAEWVKYSDLVYQSSTPR